MKRMLPRAVALSLALVAMLGAAAQAGVMPLLYYSFEPPDVHTDGVATDNSANGLDGTLLAIGTGSYQYSGLAAPVPGSTQSLELTELGDYNAARLSRNFGSSTLNVNTGSWSMSGWLNRTDSDTPDFVFHLGSGDGYGGGNELYIEAVANTNNIALSHYYNSSKQVAITASNAIPVGTWHHVAVVHDAAAGAMTFYVDGSPIGTDTSFGMALPQSSPTLHFGGHDSTTYAPSRWFHGYLDDMALYPTALSGEEVGQLFRGAPPLNIPEPTTLALLGIGLLPAALRRARRRRAV